VAEEYIHIRKSQVSFYKDIPLYYQPSEKKFVLYKVPGVTLNNMRVANGLVPDNLYINQKDKIRGIQEAQKGFNQRLKEDIRSNRPEKVKETLVNIMEETLKEPRSGSLEGVSETVAILVSEYTKEPDVIRNLLFVSSKDYTTVLHSINVMALVLGYAFYVSFSLAEKKVLGLSALLHDVGKTKIDTELLKASRRLTDEEFMELQQHTVLGFNILDNCKFGSSEVKLAALHHHERIDGSGYPNRITRISNISQIVSFIDCYEALTNDDRPYRRAMDPLKALELIRNDVGAKKFNRNIFEKFAYSLTR